MRAAEAAARAAEKALHDWIAQAQADLREIVEDAFEDLQAVAPEATFEERQGAGPYGPAGEAILTWSPGFALSTGDATLLIYVWERETPYRPRFVDLEHFEPDDILIRAGCVVISNRRSRDGVNAANLAYEQAGGRLAWQAYRFHIPKDRPSKYHAPDGVHGLGWRQFIDGWHRDHRIPATVAPLTCEALLEFFREAVDLPPPAPWNPLDT